MHIRLLVLMSILLLAGCSFPKTTARELRQSDKESLDVTRAYTKVVEDMRQASNKCLNAKSVVTTIRSNGFTDIAQKTYKATVLAGARKAELHIQKSMIAQGQAHIGSEPPGGHYYVLVDIAAVAGGKTHLDIYHLSGKDEVLIDGIKQWASGASLGCPDLTAN